jgi:hypothetical protein
VAAAPFTSSNALCKTGMRNAFVIVRLRYRRIPKDRSGRSSMAVRDAGLGRRYVSVRPEQHGT